MEKLAERIKVETLQRTERLGTTATLYYNGVSITTSAIGVDMAEQEEAHFVVNCGTVLGALATLKNSIYHSQTNDPTTASLLTGASFTDITPSSGDDTTVEASVSMSSAVVSRYLFLVTELQGTPITADMSAVANLRAKSAPVSKTLAFDL